MKTGFIEEIDEDTIRLSILSHKRGEIILEGEHTFHKREFKKPPDVKEFILNLPSWMLSFRILKLPFKDKDKIDRVVPFELSGFTLLKPEEFVFQARVLQKDEMSEDSAVLVGFLKKEDLLQKVQWLKQRGIEVSRVTSLVFRYLSENPDKMPLSEGKVLEEERKRLMMKEMKEGDIDFLAASVGMQQKRESLLKFMARALILVFLVLFFIGINLFILYYKESRYRDSLNSHITKTYKELMPSSKVVAPLYQMKATLKQMRETLRTIDSPDTLDILLKLSKNWTDTVKVNSIEIKPERTIIKGETRELKDLEDLKSLLQKGFPSVRVMETEKGVNELFRFTMEIKE
jgi:hypothetical protein